MDIKRQSAVYSVSPQLRPEEVAEAARLGFKTLINNRPDGEDPDQPSSDQIAAAAAAAGLAYHYLPMKPGEVTVDMVSEFIRIVREDRRPVLGYCKSGARSALLWRLCGAQLPADEEVV